MDRHLKRTERIGKSDELRGLFVTPNRVSGATVSIRYALADNRRVAFTTRGIQQAVARNRIKRKLKEIYRHNKECFPENRAYLFVVRPSALDREYAALKTEVITLGLAITQRSIAHA